MLRANSTELAIGEIPRVIGTLSAFSQNSSHKSGSSQFPCDIVEVRLDQIADQTNWLEQCQQIEQSGPPVILTIRHQAEGGAWGEPEEHRVKLFEQALTRLSCVDVEFKSEIASSVSQVARGLNKACIMSFHDFEKTPNFEELRSVVSEAEKLGSIVKISTMIKSEKDLETLAALLSAPRNAPLCVIGMGAKGTHTRISFAAMGSCLTYGYLDRPMAPGQISALNLVEALRKTLPKYNDDFVSRKQTL
jgi:3-dehydroquinate dehydratase-1